MSMIVVPARVFRICGLLSSSAATLARGLTTLELQPDASTESFIRLERYCFLSQVHDSIRCNKCRWLAMRSNFTLGNHIASSDVLGIRILTVLHSQQFFVLFSSLFLFISFLMTSCRCSLRLSPFFSPCVKFMITFMQFLYWSFFTFTQSIQTLSQIIEHSAAMCPFAQHVLQNLLTFVLINVTSMSFVLKSSACGTITAAAPP